MNSEYTYIETKEEEIVIRAHDVYKGINVPQFFFDHCEFRLVRPYESFISSVTGQVIQSHVGYIPLLDEVPEPRFILSLDETRDAGDDVVYRYIVNNETKKVIGIEKIYTHQISEKFLTKSPSSVIFIDPYDDYPYDDYMSYYKNMDVFRPAKLGENYLSPYTSLQKCFTCIEEDKLPVIILKKITQEEFESVPPVNLLVIYPRT